MVEAGAAVDRQFGDVRIPVLIAMAGLPGAGKSTIAEIIGARLGASIVSVDPIESAILSAGINADEPTGLAAYLEIRLEGDHAGGPRVGAEHHHRSAERIAEVGRDVEGGDRNNRSPCRDQDPPFRL